MLVAISELGVYASPQNFRLLLTGAGAATLAVAALALVRSGRVGGLLLGALGPLLGLYITHWVSWPDPTAARLATALVVGVVAGAGYERLRSARGIHRGVPVLVLLASCGGVWLAVPENSPVLVVTGVTLGVVLCGRSMDAGVGYGIALAVAWSVLIGARPTGFSFVGGLLTLAPLVAVAVVSSLGRGRRWTIPAWPWLIMGSGAVAFAAARWIGVAPDATWLRVVVVGGAAALLAPVAGRVR